MPEHGSRHAADGSSGPAWTQRFVIARRLLPLNDLAKKFEWDKRIVPFMPGMGTHDGTMYALPKTTETQVLFCNDTLFKKNGWTPPTDRDAFEAHLLTLSSSQTGP